MEVLPGAAARQPENEMTGDHAARLAPRPMPYRHGDDVRPEVTATDGIVLAAVGAVVAMAVLLVGAFVIYVHQIHGGQMEALQTGTPSAESTVYMKTDALRPDATEGGTRARPSAGQNQLADSRPAH